MGEITNPNPIGDLEPVVDDILKKEVNKALEGLPSEETYKGKTERVTFVSKTLDLYERLHAFNKKRSEKPTGFGDEDEDF